VELSKNPEKKAFACQMLAERAAALGRLPTRADFSETDIVFIKAHLGPWPRALETAGLKPKSTKGKRGAKRTKRQKKL
jgi:hypothetical protein